jgi:lipopolysaccharide export system permease protein
LIISRYLFREIIYTLLALTGLLILIYLSHRFMFYLVQASTGIIPASFILQFLGLKLLSDMMVILPLSLFLSTLLALGRLYKDNEITALAACGIPVPFTSILGLGVGFALIIAILSLIVAPWAKSQIEVLKVQASAVAEISAISAGRFKEFGGGNGVFYVETLSSDNTRMEGIFVQANMSGKQVILTARQGYQKTQGDDLFMVLLAGHRYESKADSLEYVITDFAEHTIKLPNPNGGTPQSRLIAVPTWELWTMTDRATQAELQWRFSLPLTAILLTALAVPLSRTNPRQGQYAKLFTGIMISLIYNNLLSIAQKWTEKGDVPLWLGVWWVHGVLLLIILGLIYTPQFKMWLYFRKLHSQS